MIVGDTIAAPLSNTASSVEVGKTVFVDRDQGHCVLCHQIDGLDAEFQGNVGPDLSTVGDRLSAAQIRFRIVDLQSLIPDTVMPSYYRLHDLNQVQEEFQDQTILSAEQIEHLVAYLTSRTQD
tara:strand:+ start:268 stop:636 length:369 start_codon:yes stop_codon:yes gene_type:complete